MILAWSVDEKGTMKAQGYCVFFTISPPRNQPGWLLRAHWNGCAPIDKTFPTLGEAQAEIAVHLITGNPNANFN